MQEESPTTQNKLLEEAYERAINGNRWKQIQEFIRSSQSSLQYEEQPLNQRQNYNAFSGVSKSQNGLTQFRENINGNSFANQYVIKRSIAKQTALNISKSQLPKDSGFNTQNYLQQIDVKKHSQNFNPLVQSYQQNMKSVEYKLQVKDEGKNIFDIHNKKDKVMIKSEYDNKSLDTKSQVTQITDTVHSQKPVSQIGFHLQQKSLNNRKSFQKFKSPLINQKEIDMHLKDINNQYVVESVKESKSISKTNELKNQYRGQLSNKSSQQIDSTKNLIKKKQKLMTIQQNESQDIKIGNAAHEVDQIEIQKPSIEQQIFKQQMNYADAIDQESLNAITSKYQSLKSYYGQNQGSGSNQKHANQSDNDSNNDAFRQSKVVRQFESKKNSDYYNKLQQNNKQKLSVSKKSQNVIKSSREETSINRNQKQLQFQDQNRGQLFEQKINYSDNLSAYDMNKSSSFSQNIKDFGHKKNNYQMKSEYSQSIKGQLLSTQKLIANQFQNKEIGRIKTPIRQKSTISDNLSRKVQNQEVVVQFFTEHDIKKELIESFQKIRLDVYSDILRIKKPQTQAHIAGQILCKTVNSFRGGQNKHIGVDSKFQIWETIQEYVHKQPNVIKFNQEVTQLIQHMILSKDYLNQIKSDQLKNHLKKIQKIQLQYFGLKTKSEIIKTFQTNKNFQIIVNLCFCICRYVLYHSGRTNQINLKYEQILNFEDIRSRSNIRSDYEKNSTNRSHISQTIGQKSESLSTNIVKNKNEKLLDQSDGFQLNQSISTKGFQKKSPPRIQDQMMIESTNSMCTPKQSIVGFKNNILQSRENKTDMVRKSTIRKEDSFQGISKLKNFQYINESFHHSNQKNLENKQSPIQQISQDNNIFHQNQQQAAQNYSFIQQNQNQNVFQQKRSHEFKNNEIIFESKNEYIEKVKIQSSEMQLDSKRSFRSNKKLLQSSYYFTPQGKNLSAHTKSDQKSSYQLNPKQIKKLKVFDRLSMSGVQRKKLQQQSLKNSPQKLILFSQANEVIKQAADLVKLNIAPKQIQEYEKDQPVINQQNEKENFFLLHQKVQGSSHDFQKYASQHSFNNQSITYTQEVNGDQQQRKSPLKLPDSSNVQSNLQTQSLYNPSLIIQVKNQDKLKKNESSKKNKLQIQFVQSSKKDFNDEEVQNFSRQTVDSSFIKNVNQVQSQNIKQRKSRQERSTGKKSVIKESKFLKSNVKTFNPTDYDQQNLEILDEFVKIEQNVIIKQDEQIQGDKNSQADQETKLIINDQNKEDVLEEAAFNDENELFEPTNLNQSQIEEQKNMNLDEEIIQVEEVYKEEPTQEKIDIHYLQAYNSINDMPFQIFANQQDNSDQASEKSEQEIECYIDPVQEAQRIIGIIKAELEEEESQIPQVQELRQTKTELITQHLRCNSTNQQSELQTLNEANKTLHKKHQTLLDLPQDNFGVSSQENTEQSVLQQSILDSKFQQMKKFKYLEILRNKKSVNAQKPQISNNEYSEQASTQQKFEQNIQQKEAKIGDEFLRNSNDLIEEPQTAEIPFLKLINQSESMPFEQRSEKISFNEQNETRDQLQYEQFDEFQEQNTNEKRTQQENKSSEENEQYYMQEIVSPFRKLRASLINAENKPQSPIKNEEEPALMLEKIEWEINPVQIRRDSKEQEMFEQNNDESKNEFQELNFDNEALDYFNEGIPEKEEFGEIISPGKLKSTVVESRKHIMERIDETQKEIEENSPTRNSGVNIDMIQRLKERRIQKIKTLEDASALLQNNQD